MLSKYIRLQQIVQVFFKHGLGAIFSPFNKELPSDYAARLAAAFSELGGAFVKFGQVMSLRPDIVGFDIARAFESMLDNVPAEGFDKIKPVITKSIPHFSAKFKSIEETPIGSGSIAQVHRAVLTTNHQVVIKVRRANVEKTFLQDLAILKDVAGRLSKRRQFQTIKWVELITIFEQYTLNEIDLRHEAANQERFEKLFRGHLVVPKVYRDLSNESVLVMDYFDGTTLAHAKKLTPAQKKKIITQLVQSIFTQIFEHGFFHADLHPANVMLLKDGRIGFLDFGIIGHLDMEVREKLFDLVVSLTNGDIVSLTDSLIALNASSLAPDRSALKEGLYIILSDYYDQPIRKLPLGKVIPQLFDLARRAHITVPSNLILFSKSLVTVDGLAREYAPTLNIAEEAKKYLQNASKAKIFVRSASAMFVDAKNLLKNVPMYVRDFNANITRLEKAGESFTEQFGRFEESFNVSVSVLVLGIICGSLIISGALLWSVVPTIGHISLISLCLYVLAFVLLIWILFKITKFT